VISIPCTFDGRSRRFFDLATSKALPQAGFRVVLRGNHRPSEKSRDGNGSNTRETGLEKSILSRRARSGLYCRSRNKNGNPLAAFAAVAISALPAPASAVEMPDDVWSGKYGGMPSVTVDAEGHVSMELPANAIEVAGGGSVAGIAKDFLEKWASGACFEVFDFQSPHKKLKVQIAVLHASESFVFAGAQRSLFTPSGYIDVVIDYVPKGAAKCTAAPAT
jgi:hypothetical protein